MNPYKIISFFLLISVLPINIIASQNLSIGISANAGLSHVKSKITSSSNFKDKHSLSYSYGAFMEKKIANKSSLGLELLWVQIQGREKRVRDELRVFNGQEIEVAGYITDESRLHSSYMAIPIYYKYILAILR